MERLAWLGPRCCEAWREGRRAAFGVNIYMHGPQDQDAVVARKKRRTTTRVQARAITGASLEVRGELKPLSTCSVLAVYFGLPHPLCPTLTAVRTFLNKPRQAGIAEHRLVTCNDQCACSQVAFLNVCCHTGLGICL